VPWFKVDDGFWAHPKVLELSPDAGWLWTRAGSYSAQQLTDGRITQATLLMLGCVSDAAAELVSSGLWDVTRNGWQFHDWDVYQPTREEVLADRAKTAERMRRYREKRRNAGEGDAVTDGVTDGASASAPTRPDPTITPSSTKKVGASRATRIPDPFMVSDRMRQWARDEVPGVDVDRATRMFVDHFRAASGQNASKKDWVAAWRNWLRKDYGNLSPQQRQVSRPPKQAEGCNHRYVGGYCAECSEREP
jgi:hypothetical protein